MTKSYSQKELIEKLEKELSAGLDRADRYDRKLWQAMDYSLISGGKRIRPVLLMLTGLSLYQGKDPDGFLQTVLLPYAQALEMIHTYSLIHDDLPAMDDDDYRRGRLTNHKVFGEAEAILAGDALLTLAFETMSNAAMRAESDKLMWQMIRAQAYIAECAGPKGMVGGQIADLQSEGRSIDLAELTYIELNKTSRLLMAALTSGAILGGATIDVQDRLKRAGELLGIAFQIEDDVLDVIGDQKELGKPIGSDQRAQKATFVSIYGLEKAKEEAKRLTEQVIELLGVLPGEYGETVRKLCSDLVDRRK